MLDRVGGGKKYMLPVTSPGAESTLEKMGDSDLHLECQDFPDYTRNTGTAGYQLAYQDKGRLFLLGT